MKKTSLGLLFGGRSCEHEVSVTSARSIHQAIDRAKYDVFLIGIDKSGHWRLGRDFEQLIAAGCGAVKPPPGACADSVTLALHHRGNITPSAPAVARQAPPNMPALDVIFPALHGTFGEDGTIQGVCEMAGIPYVGCGVAASALALDKSLAKKIFRAAGIPQAAHLDISPAQWREPKDVLARSEKQLGYPVFVKPANLGSSVGISKAHARAQLRRAIDAAFRFDGKVIIEQSMENCIEAECAVLGNTGGARASIVGEIAPAAEFYDYASKYIDDTAELVAPARIPEHAGERVRELSLAAFDEIGGAGLARVDFFVHRETWRVTLNEINTLPGFTPISMYPRLWEASGVPYRELIDRLIALALETHRAKSALRRALD